MIKHDEYKFQGPLAKRIEAFIEEKQSVGYKYTAVKARMKNFDRFSIGYETSETTLLKELVEGWLFKNENESDGNHRQKLYAMLEFGKYMIRNGYTAYVPQKSFRAAISKDFIPYIFSKKELSQLLDAFDSINNPVNFPYLSLLYGGIFRILCCCGLRVSEALELKVENVDLFQGILTVLDAKLGKNKLVPMDESLTEYLRNYYELNKRILKSGDYFFPSKIGKAYTVGAFYIIFRKCLWKSKISHGGIGNGPRVHDLSYPYLNKIRTFSKTA